MIRDLAAQIAREKIAPIAAELDESGEFPWEIVKTPAQSDLLRVFIPAEYEGLGGGIMEMFACRGGAVACVRRHRAVVRALVSAPSRSSCSGAMNRREVLPRLAAGRYSRPWAYGVERGSDAGASRQRQKRTEILCSPGTKQWITNGGEASSTRRLPADPRAASRLLDVLRE